MAPDLPTVDFSVIESWIVDTKNTTDALNDQITSLQHVVSSHECPKADESQLEELRAELADSEDEVSAAKAREAELRAQVNDLTAQVSDLQEKLGAYTQLAELAKNLPSQ